MSKTAHRRCYAKGLLTRYLWKLARALSYGEEHAVGEIRPLLRTLVVNRSFMLEFVTAEPPCCGLGLVEEQGRPCGFLAIRPGEIIPPAVLDLGFNFGHSLLGTSQFEVVHFAFAFYGFGIYNVLVNPSNPIVRTVLSTMVASGDYFFFMLDPEHHVTAFRSAIGQADLVNLETHLPRLLISTTTDAQYERTVRAFTRHPDPPGDQLTWVCRDRIDCLDLSTDRLDLTPA